LARSAAGGRFLKSVPNDLPKWSVYQCRHARLTEVREALDLEAAQAVAGHSSVRMTEHYTRVRIDLPAMMAAASG
jgi:hypothetical protein